jgi:hypothetical protein
MNAPCGGSRTQPGKRGATSAAGCPGCRDCLTTYTVDCTPPDRERRTLRVRGRTEAEALQGARDYLARQWDGIGWIHEETLEEVGE